jgi:amino acid permease
MSNPGDLDRVAPVTAGTEAALLSDEPLMQSDDKPSLTTALHPQEDPSIFDGGDSLSVSEMSEANMSSLVGPDGRPLPPNGIAVTVILLLNNCIGAWILGIPASFKGPGMIPCLIMIFLLTLLSRINSFLIQRMAIRTGAEGLEDMIGRVYGSLGSKIAGGASIPLYIIVHISYILVGSEIFMKWLELIPSIDQSQKWFRPVMLIVYAAIPIAGTIPPEISFLSKLMPISIGSIFLLVIGLSVQAIIDFSNQTPSISSSVNYFHFTAPDLFLSLSVHSGTMTLPGGQSAPLKAYVRDIRRQEKVLTLTYALCYVIYCLPSILIYLDKGDEILSNVLMSFDRKNWIIIIIQVGVVLKVTMTFVGVHMIYQIWMSQMIWGTTRPPTKLKRAILMILTYAASLGGALVLTDLLPVLGIGGALGLVGMYVLAPMAELKTSGWVLKSKQGIFDVCLITIGVFTTIVSFVFSVKSAVESFA